MTDKGKCLEQVLLWQAKSNEHQIKKYYIVMANTELSESLFNHFILHDRHPSWLQTFPADNLCSFVYDCALLDLSSVAC